jgi:acetoin utilization protein AcuB
MRQIPRIKTVMTPFPYSITPSAPIDVALTMMGQHDIRHLPVCESHMVVGILSERDARVALTLRPGDTTITVSDVCMSDPFLVDLELPLDEVTAEMAKRRIGLAIVMRGDKLAGILTTTDVCRLLATGGAGISEPDPLQQAPQGGTLRRLGATDVPVRGHARRLQIPAHVVEQGEQGT